MHTMKLKSPDKLYLSAFIVSTSGNKHYKIKHYLVHNIGDKVEIYQCTKNVCRIIKRNRMRVTKSDTSLRHYDS